MSNIDKQALRGLSVESPFYLAECCNCGEVMPSSKLRVLHSPDGEADCCCPHCNADDCDIADSGAAGSEGVMAWNYQQKRIEALLDELEAEERRRAEQSDYFSSLVAMARTSADKAVRKFPQPNYVLLKVAEEAGEVVQAGVHYAENRMTWDEVEGEIVQLLAMLIRLVTEGDQINGVTPPQAVRVAGIGIKE